MCIPACTGADSSPMTEFLIHACEKHYLSATILRRVKIASFELGILFNGILRRLE